MASSDDVKVKIVSAADDLQITAPRLFEKAAGDTACNICLRVVPALTEDHVPPQSCMVERRVMIDVFGAQLAPPDADFQRGTLSQSGLRYKTICGDCNSMLGKKFDPALEKFAASVRDWTKAALVGPTAALPIPSDAPAIAKSVCGHILSAKVKIDDIKLDIRMRDYVLGRAPDLQGDHIFYWLHPYAETVVVRDVGMPGVRGNFNAPAGIFNILKFFPLGFLVTTLDEYMGLFELPQRSVPSGLLAFPPLIDGGGADWPERRDRGNFVMGGPALNASVTARPAPKKL